MSTPVGTPLLELRGVRKRFDRGWVLRGIDLAVAPHTVTALIGASGSGKSTLLRCVNLLETVDDGEVLLDGEDIADPRVDVDDVRTRVGIVFQSYNLFPHLDVVANIALAPRRVLKRPAAQTREHALELLERFGLADKAHAYPDRLSGGQQQRVAIVRALAMRPRLLLLDEITAALDPVLVGEVLDIVRELQDDGLTMVIATHEMGFAREVAAQVCFLEDGVVRERGTPDQVFGDPQDERTQQFLRRVTAARRL